MFLMRRSCIVRFIALVAVLAAVAMTSSSPAKAQLGFELTMAKEYCVGYVSNAHISPGSEFADRVCTWGDVISYWLRHPEVLGTAQINAWLFELEEIEHIDGSEEPLYWDFSLTTAAELEELARHVSGLRDQVFTPAELRREWSQLIIFDDGHAGDLGLMREEYTSQEGFVLEYFPARSSLFLYMPDETGNVKMFEFFCPEWQEAQTEMALVVDECFFMGLTIQTSTLGAGKWRMWNLLGYYSEMTHQFPE